jgi:hypothetical protein
LILKKIEEFDSGSYMCIGETSSLDGDKFMNSSSETTLIVNGKNSFETIQSKQSSLGKNQAQSIRPRLSNPKQSAFRHDFSEFSRELSDLETSDDLGDEFPSLNPTIVENSDEKGYCEPYKGSICAGIITSNYSIYSTSANQQEMIEERLRSIIPLLASSSKNNQLSKRCSTFAIPSLCLFAFPLCDRYTGQPKQICRMDCKQLQQDICKSEYFSVRSLFESKLSDSLQQQSGNFLLDCNQLPPSSDMSSQCLPIVAMTLDKLESHAISPSMSLPTSSPPPALQPPSNYPLVPKSDYNEINIADLRNKCIILNGADYSGTQSYTQSGYKCQPWQDQYPHMHNYASLKQLQGHNYCRNVDNDAEPWCFTMNSNKRKEYCGIPKCTLEQIQLIKQHEQFIVHRQGEPSGDVSSALFNDKLKLINLMYILVPSICVPFALICLLLTFCYCRKSGNSSNAAGKTNNSMPHVNTVTTTATTTTSSSIASTNNSNLSQPSTLQHHNRLRMSNGSLAKKTVKHGANIRATGSSKSSVASSVTNNLINYDHHQHPTYVQQIQQQQQQTVFQPFQQQLIQQQPQLAMYNSANGVPLSMVDFSLGSVKHYTASNLRLLQEIGKGRFGSVYVGELVGSLAPNSVIKVFIKTLNQAKSNTNCVSAPMSKIRCFVDENNQVTSTPNVNLGSSSITGGEVKSAEEHFIEQEFYNEINLYSSLRSRHIANLIGVLTSSSSRRQEALENGDVDNIEDMDDDSCSMLTDNSSHASNMRHPQCMIFEHFISGDLHEYLIQRGTAHVHHQQQQHQQQANMMTYGSQSNLSAASSSVGGVSSGNYLTIQQQQRNVADFLYIAQQIASGMEYLSSNNFVMKDLATRNVLVGDNLTCKISIDLVAQYKEQYAKDYYKLHTKPLPVRWMSPESLLYGRYTQQSDVWMYGVCLWEIFNYGCQPYSGCTNPEAIEMIRDRQLLLIPDECPPRAYALMLDCWHEIPIQRPTFTEIHNRLRSWENYYSFTGSGSNSNNNINIVQQTQMPPPPPPPPMPIQQQPQMLPSFQMSASYSSNSQNSRTASTGVSSSCTPPPPPPPPQLPLPPPPPMPMPVQLTQQTLFQVNQNNCYSPSKNFPQACAMAATNNSGTLSTNLFASKFNSIQTATMSNSNGTNVSRFHHDTTNSLRMSQRSTTMSNGQPNTFNFYSSNTSNQNNINSANMNHIPNGGHFQFESHHLDL